MLPRLGLLTKRNGSKTKRLLSTKASSNFEIGEEYHNFKCLDKQRIEEFKMTAVLLEHSRTKTEYLHLDRDDPNNVFSINFRTTPFTSAGTPHILEHTVLCGSKKYPVRDPFFKMLNRSLATFMNAMTGPDYTFYPFSTQNETDFKNLQSIYLDAVFKPSLKRLDFLQEGWRLEHSDPSDKNSEIIFKGVVYNEMKGAFSETSQLFGQKFLNEILPDGTYGYVSGGDPLKIPELSHSDLRKFHARYYHPSNARIYSYGNFPLENHLKTVDESYLSEYEFSDPEHSVVHSQKRFTEPKTVEIRSRYDQMGAPLEKQNQIAVGYIMNDVRDVYSTFELQLLSELLIVGPNSAFYKSLIEPNISGGYNGITGFDPQMRDTLFTIGLQDIKTTKFDYVTKTIDHTIANAIEKGFDKQHVSSVLHSIELAIKHQSTRFGLNLLFNIVALWNHGGSTINALKINDFLNALKLKFQNDPRYLNKLVEKYFASNPHRLTMTMRADREYEATFLAQEEDVLKRKIALLTPKERNAIFNDGIKLAEVQKKIQNIDVLPCLAIGDINVTKKRPTLRTDTFDTVPVQFCEADTNGVTYFRGILDITTLGNEQKMLIPLFNAIASKFDTNKHSYRDFDQLVNSKTAGLSFSTHISPKLDNPMIFEEGVRIDSHCLDANISDMFDLWSEIFAQPKFNDVERFEMLYNNYVSNLTPGLVQSGHQYAMQMAQSLVSGCGEISERLSGVSHIIYMMNASKERSFADILKDVAGIGQLVLDRSRLRVAINANSESKSNVYRCAERFLTANASGTDPNSIRWTKSNSKMENGRGIHVSMSLPVNYCASAVSTVPYTHVDFAKLRVLARFLSLKYLHPIVREQNGAYGGGATVSNGVFQFYSYRDPNSVKTLNVFDETARWLTENRAILDEQALYEAKLGVLQQVDAPIAEHSQGLTDFLNGLDYDAWVAHRLSILSVTVDDCFAVAEKYLNGDQQTGRCVIGPGSDELTKRDSEKWNVITGPN